jgi:hypothetical protein
MGGQACVLYGAAEFSRDTDLAVIADADNLNKLTAALGQLQAQCIALPPFAPEYLKRGHAVHFRCGHPDATGMRIDVMEVMRGVDPFQELWNRRTTAEVCGGLCIEVMSLPDLVLAKKTQRDKDWPMIRRLVETNHAENAVNPSAAQVLFWLREGRTPTTLIEAANQYPEHLETAVAVRPLLTLAAAGDEMRLVEALEHEEKKEREADRLYWLPLRAELQRLRAERGTR